MSVICSDTSTSAEQWQQACSTGCVMWNAAKWQMKNEPSVREASFPGLPVSNFGCSTADCSGIVEGGFTTLSSCISAAASLRFSSEFQETEGSISACLMGLVRQNVRRQKTTIPQMLADIHLAIASKKAVLFVAHDARTSTDRTSRQ